MSQQLTSSRLRIYCYSCLVFVVVDVQIGGCCADIWQLIKGSSITDVLTRPNLRERCVQDVPLLSGCWCAHTRTQHATYSRHQWVLHARGLWMDGHGGSSGTPAGKDLHMHTGVDVCVRVCVWHARRAKQWGRANSGWQHACLRKVLFLSEISHSASPFLPLFLSRHAACIPSVTSGGASEAPTPRLLTKRAHSISFDPPHCHFTLFFCFLFFIATQTAAAKGLETCEGPPELGAERALAVGGGRWAEHEGGGTVPLP